ncbi:hypothetical protein [Dyella terrae]|uniref:hypothetical protein n=1 Tax=Dyella terrae TaxID=522259 RepID=UPI001EFD8556|nr:hypothetical protein [Dyella terrae]ULU26583.1 hypothetical protein DYST_03529 [Dyella terrae]
MSNPKFSQLPLSGALTGTETVVGLQGGTASQITTQAIADLPSTTKAVAGEITSVNNQVGTAYVLQGTDKGALVVATNASAITVTVPQGIKQKTVIYIKQGGAGQVTLVPASGVTLDTAASVSTRVVRSVIALVFHANDAATVVGDLA